VKQTGSDWRSTLDRIAGWALGKDVALASSNETAASNRQIENPTEPAPRIRQSTPSLPAAAAQGQKV